MAKTEKCKYLMTKFTVRRNTFQNNAQMRLSWWTLLKKKKCPGKMSIPPQQRNQGLENCIKYIHHKFPLE